MQFRPYINTVDYEYIEKWLKDERTHALWCANLIPYPITRERLKAALEKETNDWGGTAYVVTENDGRQIGFFVYSVNPSSNSGFLKFVVLDNELRGKGYGREMLRLVLKYAFDITGVDSVQLNVFDVNSSARKCYAKLGFVEDNVIRDAFTYHKEMWARCHMVIQQKKWRRMSVYKLLMGN